MKKIVILLLLACDFAALYGQENTLIDSVVSNLTNQLLVFPHEKIYLHTDKPYYITGEKIFFRAFLLDALSNQAAKVSRYVYVELINPADSVVQRVKIRPDENNLFHGIIQLPEELPQGTYQMRSYTHYMFNQGESTFFSKYVKISDPQVLSVEVQTDFQFTEDKKINASLRFIDAKTQEIIHPQSVTLRLNLDPSFSRRPDKEGWIRVKLNIPDKATTRVLYLELLENNNIFKQYIQVPYPEGDFDVSFYPEGGHLIAFQSTNVAFKAINTQGKTLDIKGEVTDSKGNVVAEFITFHDGMGEFYINPQLDEHYRAICHYGNRTTQFDLPEVQTNTYAIKAAIRDKKLWITINNYNLSSHPELYLLIHSGGAVFYAKAWNPEKDFINFDASAFPSGINHIVLLTKDLQIISERLVFLLNDDYGLVEFQTQKNDYRKREQTQVGIKLRDEEKQSITGNFSIAVTNDREVLPDSTSGILSGILLRSELKGHIENPEYYFRKGNKEAELAADLLMKTHGWTRYAIPDVIRGELSFPEIPFEVSQEISGTVKSGLLSKLAKDFNVSLISLNNGFFDLAETDENGRFIFQYFEFPDSTKYVIQALNSKGKGRQMTELYVDEFTFPGINAAGNKPLIWEEKTNPVFLDYVAKADLHYTYENGMRIVNLPEVVVKGSIKDKNKYQSSFYFSPDFSISEEEIERYGTSDIKNLLYRVPGVMVMGDRISIRGSTGEPLILIDDIPYTSMDGETAVDILNRFSVYDVGQLDVLKNAGNLAMFGSRGGNGVIAIHTKRGVINTPLPSFNIKQLTPLGYQMPVEFYSPKYDTQASINDPVPDLRTTIYWKPDVLTDDEGNATLDFYTADDPATYSVIIEGVSDDGRLIHFHGKSLIEVK